MPDLSSYPNVWNTALVILKKKGFVVWTDESESTWHAKKESWTFFGDDPINLLGLVAIFEEKKPEKKAEHWWKIDSPDLLSTIPKSEPL